MGCGALEAREFRLSPMIDSRLLDMLACPQDKQPLEYHGTHLVNPRLSVAYPIEEGIPVLLVEKAVAWPLAEGEQK